MTERQNDCNHRESLIFTEQFGRPVILSPRQRGGNKKGLMGTLVIPFLSYKTSKKNKQNSLFLSGFFPFFWGGYARFCRYSFFSWQSGCGEQSGDHLWSHGGHQFPNNGLTGGRFFCRFSLWGRT